MNLFRDRIVLADGVVVMPDKVRQITKCGSLYIIISENRNIRVPELDIRIDRATGYRDSNGVEIFERDRVNTEYGNGVVVIIAGEWRISYDAPDMVSRSLLCAGDITITGYLSWEECHE